MGPWRRLLYRWDRRNQAWADRKNASPEPDRPSILSTCGQVAVVVLWVGMTIGHVRSRNWLGAGFFGAGTAFLLALAVYVLIQLARTRAESGPDASR